MDHELSHCERDAETGNIMLVGHDVEEFTHILRRYGLWHTEVQMFATAAAEQMSLLAIIEQRAENADLAETVTVQRVNGQTLTMTREELLAAFYKLEAESKLGLVMDSVAAEINKGALDSDRVTVTAETKKKRPRIK